MTFNVFPRAFLTLLALLLSGVSAPMVKASDCYQSNITAPSPFMGNNDEVFVLTDGSVWQVKYEYEYLYEYSPSAIICPSQSILIIKGKSLNVAPVRGATGGSRSTAPRDALTVIYRVSGCDYFVADGPSGLYVLEWYRGYDPRVGDKFAGYARGYGFKDIIYLHNGREGRIYVEDYLLSADRAAEVLGEKC